MALPRYPFSRDSPRHPSSIGRKGGQKSSSRTGIPDTCRIPVLLPSAQPSRSSCSGNGNPPVGQSPWNAGKSVLLPLLPFPPPDPRNRPWYPENVSRAQYIYNESEEKFHFILKKVVAMLVKRPKPMYLCNRKQGGTLLKRVPLWFAPRKGRVL